mmetsp:Transcript_38436/g.62476  ORF Transcript_38436/g.62476 Transcript_38436/m.62476 type:complete len:88 (+) Transcript_38436:112-375(+)
MMPALSLLKDHRIQNANGTINPFTVKKSWKGRAHNCMGNGFHLVSNHALHLCESFATSQKCLDNWKENSAQMEDMECQITMCGTMQT